jgi:nickel-dependent lactate racemase
MTDYGRTSRGIPVQLNARLKESALVVLYSSVVYHYFAGYGGGRKLIMPGIASLETIRANHSLTWLSAEEGGGRNPMAASGVLDGNPVHEDMLEGARMALAATPSFTVAAVLTPEEEFAHFSAGEIGEAHRAACAFVDRHNLVHIDRPADIVFASAGGHPKDINFIQSHKGLDNAVRALKPGGILVYAMACAEGLGDPVMEDFVPLDAEAIKKRLLEHYVVFGQTIHAMKLKTAAFRVICITGLDPEVVSDLGAIHAADAGEALDLVAEELDRASRVYHLPRADVTLPRLAQ